MDRSVLAVSYTHLAAVKAELVSHTSVNYQDVLFGSIPGSLGEVSALLLLVGAVYLLWRKVITWHIPVAVLGTMAVFVFLVGLGPVSYTHLKAKQPPRRT